MNNPAIHDVEREERYQDLFDNSHDLIYTASLDGTLLYVNNTWVKLLEFSQEEIKNRQVYEFVCEEDREKFKDYRQKLISAEHEGGQIIISFVSKSGKKITVEGFISVKIKNGLPLYTRGIFRDVTTKLQNENSIEAYHRQIEEREFYLLKILHNAPDAIIVIDSESVIQFWNPKSEKIFGWKTGEVIGKPLYDKIIPPEYREAHSSGMKRYMATGEAHVMNKTIDITAINKEKEQLYISLTISSIKQNDQTLFIAFIRDITEQKRNEQELDRKRIELEQSNKNLEDFAYAASHDLKEPIRKINVFADRLKIDLAGLLNERQLDIFNRMELASKRMGQLVDDLLMYSHVSMGVDQFEEIDLNAKVKLVLMDLELLVQDKEAKITVENLPVIKGHRRQIQQVFQNLISNSLKYVRQDVIPDIHIRSTYIREGTGPSFLPPRGNFHKIDIIDNGIGFEQKDAEKIFQVFQRLHGLAEYKGSGVGLSIVRKVVENHGGFVTAISEPDKGSTFELYFPA